MAEPTFSVEEFSKRIYSLLEVNYSISLPSEQLIPLTSLLTVFVQRYPRSTLSRLVLTRLIRECFQITSPDSTKEEEEEEELEIQVTGSAAELGYFAFPNGDIDIMMYYRNLVAFPTERIDTVRDSVKPLEMVSDLEFPGFVRLIQTNGTEFNHHHFYQLMVGQEPLLCEMIQHGPARMMKNLLFGRTTYDFVPAVLCRCWPPEAGEWITRTRRSGWPCKKLVEDITQFGCHVVPVGHRSSVESFKQWRLSFSTAELKLIQNLNLPQKIVYHILKGLFRTFPSEIDDNQLLSSYHLKTLILWNCEWIPSDSWTTRSVVCLCRQLLQVAKQWIDSNEWPHYFVRGSNLLSNCSDSMAVLKIEATAAINDLLQADGSKLCNTILKDGLVLSTWYREHLLAGCDDDDYLTTFLSKMDYIDEDIINYRKFEEKDYLSELTGTLFCLVYLAVTYYKPDHSSWLGLLLDMRFLNSSIKECRYFTFSASQIVETVIGINYYIQFVSSGKYNWRLHALAKRHIFHAMNVLEPNRNIFWPTLMAGWCYLEYAHNPSADRSHLIDLCDKGLEILNSNEFITIYERLRNRQRIPNLVIPRRWLFICDEVAGFIFGFLLIVESIVKVSHGIKICFENEECSPICIFYFVKIRCLLSASRITAWDRIEINRLMIKWDNVSLKYGCIYDKFVMNVVRRQVIMLDRKHAHKTRIY